jgi:ABC-type phosphonate transport system ATPase subunit
MDFCYEAFPQLAERRRKLAGSLAGGEQQMLALGRALMLAPRILPIDEPSVRPAPLVVARTIDNPSWSPHRDRHFADALEGERHHVARLDRRNTLAGSRHDDVARIERVNG